MNRILDTDSYKASHHLQYPRGMQGMFSYLESRGGLYPATVFFGLQYLLKNYLLYPINRNEVVQAEAFFTKHGEPFPRQAWEKLVSQYGGKLPIRIRAVPEGMVVPVSNILLSVESTTQDAELAWLPSWFETQIMRLWYPITVATQSYFCKQTILRHLEKSSDDPKAEIGFKLHDFGSRGVSSRESAAIGGAAHLVNFLGSDTVVGVDMANDVYNADMAGFSIPAAEHSTITSWGREREEDAYRNMIQMFGHANKVVACVSDSYDLYAAIDNFWTGSLLDDVKKSGATIVIRPDSGDPTQVIINSLRMLERKLSSEMLTNSKGFKVLPSYFRLIQGDGVNRDSIDAILTAMEADGYSATNIAFGMGGALLQQVNRDTQKFAYKCSAIYDSGGVTEVYKEPATDHGKVSKRGLLDLIRTPSGKLQTVKRSAVTDHLSVMRTVFANGEVLVEDDFATIRERAGERYEP